MAAAYARVLSRGRVEVRSAGSAPADELNPDVVTAMREDGIDITAERPRVLIDRDVRASDVVITMGCGDACPIYPGQRHEDWKFEDPAVSDLESIRRIRDGIKTRIRLLLEELL